MKNRNRCACGKPATHALDELTFCCACFDEAVEHCANIKTNFTGQPEIPINGSAIGEHNRAAFHPKPRPRSDP